MLCGKMLPVLLLAAHAFPVTNKNYLVTSCESPGLVAVGGPAILTFSLTVDPADHSYINVFRRTGNDKVHVLDIYWNNFNKMIPALAPGYSFFKIEGKVVKVVIEKASRDQSGEYYAEDVNTYEDSQRESCHLIVTGSADESMDMKARLTALEANQTSVQERLHSVERKQDHIIMNLTQLSQALWPFIVTWLVMAIGFASYSVNGNHVKWAKSKLSNCFKKKGNPADNKVEEQEPLNGSSQTNERLEKRDNATQSVETICQNHMQENPADTKHEELKQQNDDLICLVKQLLERIRSVEETLERDNATQRVETICQNHMQTENPEDSEDEAPLDATIKGQQNYMGKHLKLWPPKQRPEEGTACPVEASADFKVNGTLDLAMQHQQQGATTQTGVNQGATTQTGLNQGVTTQTGLNQGVTTQTGLNQGATTQTGLNQGATMPAASRQADTMQVITEPDVPSQAVTTEENTAQGTPPAAEAYQD